MDMMINPCDSCKKMPVPSDCERSTCGAWIKYYCHRQEYINAYAAEVGLLPEEFKKQPLRVAKKKPAKQYWRYPHPHEKEEKA